MNKPQWTHPVEAVHAARDALDYATTKQARADGPAAGDLAAYGSALAALMQAANNLAEELTDQAAAYDAEHLEQEKVRNDPVEKYYRAVRHLAGLCSDLASATDDAKRYWSAAYGMHEDLNPVVAPEQA